jgi:hypothetical protein
MAAYTPNAGAKEVFRTGKLWKEPPSGASMMRGWKKRWFVLEKDSAGIPCLRYYSNEGLTHEKGTILISEMSGARAIDNPPPDDHRPKGGLVFELTAAQLKKDRTERRYMLVTSSDVDRRGWLEAIKAHFTEEQLSKCSDVFPTRKSGAEGGGGGGASAGSSKDGAMRRETILKEQKNYTLKTADQRKGEMAYQVFDALDEDHFFLYYRSTALRKTVVALRRGDYSTNSEDPSQPPEIALFDWREKSFYIQNISTGSYWAAPLSTSPSQEISGADDEEIATMNGKLVLMSGGGVGMVNIIAAVLRVQAFIFARKAKTIASKQRATVMSLIQNVEEVIAEAGAASSADGSSSGDVNSQISLIIDNGVDLVQEATAGYTGDTHGRSVDGNIAANCGEAMPALIMAGISGSGLVKAPDEAQEIAEILEYVGKLKGVAGASDPTTGSPVVISARRGLRERCNEQEIQKADAVRETFTESGGWVFKTIRALFGITPKDFIGSIQSGLTIIGSGAGRSGAFFFITHDKKYILKSVSKVKTQNISCFTLIPHRLHANRCASKSNLPRWRVIY